MPTEMIKKNQTRLRSKVFSLEKTLVLTLFYKEVRFFGGVGGWLNLTKTCNLNTEPMRSSYAKH